MELLPSGQDIVIYFQERRKSKEKSKVPINESSKEPPKVKERRSSKQSKTADKANNDDDIKKIRESLEQQDLSKSFMKCQWVISF